MGVSEYILEPYGLWNVIQTGWSVIQTGRNVIQVGGNHLGKYYEVVTVLGDKSGNFGTKWLPLARRVVIC